MDEIMNILKEMRPEFDFSASSDFVEDGLLDSFDIIGLVSTLEEKYDVLIDGLDIVPENFCSVEAIVDLVNRNGGNLN